MCTYNYNMFCNYQCFFVKKIFAGTNTREISEMTLFFSHLHLNFKHFTTLFFYLPVRHTGALSDKKSPDSYHNYAPLYSKRTSAATE